MYIVYVKLYLTVELIMKHINILNMTCIPIHVEEHAK